MTSLHVFKYTAKIAHTMGIFNQLAKLAFIAGAIYFTGTGLYDTLHHYSSRYSEHRRKLNLEQAKYKDYWEELFEEYRYETLSGESGSGYGLADENNNGLIEIEEQVKAWRKMGFDKTYFETSLEFPKPTVSQLKKARESYRKELGRPYEDHWERYEAYYGP